MLMMQRKLCYPFLVSRSKLLSSLKTLKHLPKLSWVERYIMRNV